MREELEVISKFLESRQLPISFQDFSKGIWNANTDRFTAQETYILDYKETNPTKFGEGYGAGIVRLAIAYYNTFGGIIIFGVNDSDFSVSGLSEDFDIESLNKALTAFANVSVECIASSYTIDTADGQPRKICAVLVPRRTIEKIAKLKIQLDKYKVGTTWVRDRAEVLEVTSRHMPLLYSTRSFEYSIFEDSTTPIHRSFPPSPATMKRFIERDMLSENLWDWLIFSSQPRLYLHGPGGSGKSTLAYEFGRTIAESNFSYLISGAGELDYVIFISGKETEFDPHTSKEQVFSLRQFSDARAQYAQILYHSGVLDFEEINTLPEEEADAKLDELFSTFSGLIIVDDIDALSRRQVDTGEEMLLIKAVSGSKKTKILYTLRNAPTHAKRSGLQVPGLEEEKELPDFMKACCDQFRVPLPTTPHQNAIKDETHSLPLLIETVVGLRKFSGNYAEALSTFLDKGGDDARRYLYQREYDRLDPAGKSRQILAGLYLLESAVTFRTLCDLYQFSAEHVKDALSEASGVFISTAINDEGETLYQLSPPCVPFIGSVSRNLSYFANLSKSVEHYRTEGRQSSPEEASIIVRMDRLMRLNLHEEIVSICLSLGKDNTILVNPRIRAFIGRAYSSLGPDHREKAREWFRAAEGLGFRDVFMMRRWYNMELHSGYNLGEAERICRVMLGATSLSPRHKSEFWSKLANCHFHQAQSLLHGDRKRSIHLFQESIRCYFRALHEGLAADNIDLVETRGWMEHPVRRLIEVLGSNFEALFSLLESLVDLKHDIDPHGVAAIFESFMHARIRVDKPDVRARMLGLCTKSLKKINARPKYLADAVGFRDLVALLDDLRIRLEAIGRSTPEG